MFIVIIGPLFQDSTRVPSAHLPLHLKKPGEIIDWADGTHSQYLSKSVCTPWLPHERICRSLAGRKPFPLAILIPGSEKYSSLYVLVSPTSLVVADAMMTVKRGDSELATLSYIRFYCMSNINIFSSLCFPFIIYVQWDAPCRSIHEDYKYCVYLSIALYYVLAANSTHPSHLPILSSMWSMVCFPRSPSDLAVALYCSVFPPPPLPLLPLHMVVGTCGIFNNTFSRWSGRS